MSGFLVFLALALVVVLLCRQAGQPGVATGQFLGDSQRTVALHEAAHVVAARAVGARVTGASLARREVNVAGLPNAYAQIVFMRTPRYATGTGAGCSADDQKAREALREYPREERAAVWRSANAEAKRIARSRSGEIRREANRMIEEAR